MPAPSVGFTAGFLRQSVPELSFLNALKRVQIPSNWGIPAQGGLCGENLVESGRSNLEAERLNTGVLKRKTDLRGGPLI